jgi:hypothetical protein
MLAVGLVPDRRDTDSHVGGENTGLELCLRLMREAVTYADGVFRKRK